MGEDEGQDVIPARIASLLERRATVVTWLEKLESREGEVRPEVYRTVLEDYRGRLADVEADLVTHRSDLERSLERRRARVEELEEERTGLAAQLEEVELRHEVGEYGEEEFQGEKEGLDEALAELDEALETEREAAGRLEGVLQELRGLEGAGGRSPDTLPSGSAGVPSDEPAPGGEGPDGSPETARGTGAGVEATADAPGEAKGEQEAAELGEPAPPEAASAPEEPGGEEETREEAPTADDASAAEDYEDELDFLESLSLDEPESLDTFSLRLDEEEEEEE